MTDRPVNAVLIGLGMVADMHARAIAATGGRVRLHGVMGRDPDRARVFASRHGGPRVFDTTAMLCRDSQVDFAILATPPDARRDYIAAFAAAGLPVLMEKPVERTLTAARDIADLCAGAKLPAGVLLQHRARPAAMDLRRRIESGAMGEIASVEARVPWWRGQDYYDAPGRGTLARDGGGVMITQAIHTIDMMLCLAGPVDQVQGLAATTALHRMETEDFAAALLRFRSGAVGSLMASVTHYPGGAEEIVVNGTRASARLTSAQLHWMPQDGPEETIGDAATTGGGADPMAFSHAWHQAVIEDFAATLGTGAPPIAPLSAALAAQALIDAIGVSSRSGRPVAPEMQDG